MNIIIIMLLNDVIILKVLFSAGGLWISNTYLFIHVSIFKQQVSQIMVLLSYSVRHDHVEHYQLWCPVDYNFY